MSVRKCLQCMETSPLLYRGKNILLFTKKQSWNLAYLHS